MIVVVEVLQLRLSESVYVMRTGGVPVTRPWLLYDLVGEYLSVNIHG